MKKKYITFLFLLTTLITFGQLNIPNKTFSTDIVKIGAFQFSKDGTIIFFSDESISNGHIKQFSLTSPFDISTIELSSSKFMNLNIAVKSSSDLRVVSGIGFNNDGTEMFIVTNSRGVIEYQILKYNLSIAYDVSKAVYAGDSQKFPNKIDILGGVEFNNDGTKMITYFDGFNLSQHTLTTAFDISSTDPFNRERDRVSVLPPVDNTAADDMKFNKTGTKLYRLIWSNNSSGTFIEEYDLTIPFDITTFNYIGNSKQFNIGDRYDFLNFEFSSDGSRLYILNVVDGTLYEYSLSTPFDISTINDETLSNHSILTNDNNPIVYNQNGKFLTNTITDEITIYNVLGERVQNEKLKPGVYILLIQNNKGKIYKTKSVF